jgi:hypothetical protein
MVKGPLEAKLFFNTPGPYHIAPGAVRKIDILGFHLAFTPDIAGHGRDNPVAGFI